MMRSLRFAGGVSALALLVGMGAISAAAAQDAPVVTSTVRYDIPSQPLGDALRVFAERSGIQLAYSADLVRDKRSVAVVGSFTTERGLAQLLGGSGLRFRFIDARTISIEQDARAASQEADGERILGPVRVEGARAAAYEGPPGRNEGVAQLGGVRGRQDDEAVGYRPVVVTIGAGRPVAIEDVARSVSVLTQDQIESQDIQDIGEALRRLPGVTLIDRIPDANQFATDSGQVFSRGQNINSVQIDGGAPRLLNIIANGLLDIGAFERVELVRGPNGAFDGAANSGGGSLNLIRKRPGSEAQLETSFQVGSFDRVGVTLDMQTPSLFGSPFAFRGVAQNQVQQFSWQNHKRENVLLYGIVDAPLGDKARFELGIEFNQINEDAPYFGSVRYLDGPVINPSGSFYDNYTPPWAKREVESNQIFTRFFVDLLGSWDFDVGAAYQTFDHSSTNRYLRVNLLSNGSRARDNSGNPLPGQWSAKYDEQHSEQTFVDFKITGQFRTGILNHDLYITGDITETRGGTSQSRDAISIIPPTIRITNLIDDIDDVGVENNRTPAVFTPSILTALESSSSTGITLADTISWNDKIILNVLARRSDSEGSDTFLQSARIGPPGLFAVSGSWLGAGRERTADWVPSWSLVVKPLANLSIYGSQSQGNTPQPNLFTRDGEPLGPTTFENAEIGLKYSRERWLFSASAFDLVRTNIATSIPSGEPGGAPGDCPPLPTSRCFFLAGDDFKSTGIDVELSGEIVDGLTTQISYNYNDSVTISPSGRPPSLTQAPTHMGKALVDWTPSIAPAWSFRASASYRDVIFQSGTNRIFDPVTLRQIASIPFSFKEEPHLIVDIGATWRFHPNWSADLYIQNVTDEEYYSTVSNSSAYIAPPLTALFTLRWRDQIFGNWGGSTTGLAPFGDPADWYGALDVGLHRPSDLEAVSRNNGPAGRPINWTFEVSGEQVFSSRLGYRLNERWRIEAEGSQKQLDFGRIGGGTDTPTGVCGTRNANSIDPFLSCQKPDGEADFWALQINALYDFGRADARVRPFLGLGWGLTRSSLDFGGRMEGVVDTQYRARYAALNPRDTRIPLNLAPGERIAAEDTTITPTWQILSGLSWHLNPQATIDLTYKYTAVSGIGIDSTNLGVYSYSPNNFLRDVTQITSPVPPLGGFEMDFTDHAFTVGLRWAFGAR